MPRSVAIWLTVTPGASNIATASRWYSAVNFRRAPMTPPWLIMSRNKVSVKAGQNPWCAPSAPRPPGLELPLPFLELIVPNAQFAGQGRGRTTPAL
jgi:hypothetical protein